MPAKKARLGQNFLTDEHAAEQIVAALGPLQHAVVVEIGPGSGALTDLLAKHAGALVAIELDRMLATELRYRFSRFPNVEILEGDVLNIDFRTVLKRTIGPLDDLRPVKATRARVVGNLPYYITSDILLRLFEFNDQFDVIVLMVQREVAERVAAPPGSSDYGLLSATAQLYCQTELLFTLPPSSFSPPPKVHSSVLRLTVAPKFDALGVPAREFIAFLKTAFAMKRKTLVNNLKGNFAESDVKQFLAQAGVKLDSRAEVLSLETMARLFKSLTRT